MKAYFNSLVWIPKAALSAGSLNRVRNDLTCKVTDFQTGRLLEPVQAYYEPENLIGVGYAYYAGMQRQGAFNCHLGLEDETVEGGWCEWEDFEDRLCPRGYQAEAFANICKQARKGVPFIFKAPTGFGKTMAGAWLIGKTKRKAMVIVTNRTVARQWVKVLGECLGDPVGLIAGWKDWEKQRDYPVTVAVINSIVGEAPPAFPWSDYGTVIWDEVHRMGAREFSKSMRLFSAKVRMGLSATPSRKDTLNKVVSSFFGEPAVTAEVATMGCDVYTYAVEHTTNSRAALAVMVSVPSKLRLLSRLRGRNEQLAEQILTAWERRRNVLGLSDRIEQLGQVKALLVRMGVPASAIGVLAGEEYDPDTKTRTKVTEQDEEEAKRRQIVLATYGKAKEGLDIPRLDWGIDLTPRADGVQMVGRILRAHEGKSSPVWVTPLDRVTPFDRYYQSRMRELGGLHFIRIIL